MTNLRARKLLIKRSIRHKFAGKCAVCRKSGLLEVDHIFPKSKGGSGYIFNLQFLCRHCNAKKSSKLSWQGHGRGYEIETIKHKNLHVDHMHPERTYDLTVLPLERIELNP